jgi:U3 small nucleolar RNA-associated protein 4
MATFESSELSIIASGGLFHPSIWLRFANRSGLDTNLVIIPIQSYFSEYQRTISGLPQHPPLASATSQSLLVCWWEREVTIWRVKRAAIADKNYRLVARISLKGEENVSSASISADGSLLAAATAAEVKIFIISRNQSEGNDKVRVRKVDRIISKGARLVQFSPDGKWLAIISHKNEVFTARVQYDTDTERMESHLICLTRIYRKPTHQPAALGEYLRTINRIKFAADSSMFVVSDLAGYIDGWVLTEDESISKLSRTDAPEDSSSLNSDSEDDEEKPLAIEGQAWRRNPATSVLPRLPSAPLVLTFRPSTARPIFDRTSNNLPFDHQLLVVTSKHSIHEFSLTNGSITEWSRHNPTAVLPQQFRDLKDRTMGSFWTKGGWCWLYGANWVFGLDATANHESEESKNHTGLIDGPGDTAINERKRKWGEGGAGGKIKRKDISGLVRKNGGDFKRRDNTVNQASRDSEAEDEDDGVLLVDGLAELAAETGDRDEKKKWWMSLKYRPILGMLPIAQEDGVGSPEVVLVERPIWDLDLPPRFESAHKR